MNNFLKDNQYLYERVQLGKEVYPGSEILKQFQAEAKKIDPDRYFTIYGCDECVKTLIKFVYESNKNKSATKPDSAK